MGRHPKVSGADAQPAYTPRVQIAKAKGSTYVYDGSNDVAMIRMRKEAVAQGLNTVKVWACSIACYTKAFLAQGGAAVEGTYCLMQFLPFEEASTNADDQAYVTALGSKVDSFGAQAWQAGARLPAGGQRRRRQERPQRRSPGPSLLTALKGITNFTADGWIGPKSLQGPGSYLPLLPDHAGAERQVRPGLPDQAGDLRLQPEQPGDRQRRPRRRGRQDQVAARAPCSGRKTRP